MRALLKLILKGLLIVAVLMCIYSVWVYFQTGRFWVPEQVLRGSRTMATAVSEIPVTSSTSSPTFESVQAPKEPTYKWQKNGIWHYGSTPPKGVSAIMISEPKND